MNSTLLERVKTWIAAHTAASAARDAEIAEHGFEVNDDRWLDVLALMPPVQEIAEGLVASAAEVENLRADLATARRLLPPRYVAADGSILDPERCTPHAPDCAECGRGRAHDEECLALIATPAEEVVGLQDRVERLTAELEEGRLILAAEQGRAEGAPTGWRATRPPHYFGGLDVRWSRETTPNVWVVVARTTDGWIWRHYGGAMWLSWHYRMDPALATARAAMLAADAAIATPPTTP